MKNSKGITISNNLHNHLAVIKRVFAPTKECLLPHRTIFSNIYITQSAMILQEEFSSVYRQVFFH